jgi:hypothetical protein
MVKASGALTLRGGAEIKAESFGPGRSGDLNVSATTLSIAREGSS